MATKLSKLLLRIPRLQLTAARRLAVHIHMPHDGVTHVPIVVLGGGSGGCSMASRLCRLMDHGDVAIVEPSKFHCYQPMFTLVGAGLTAIESSERLMSEVLPRHCVLYQANVEEFDPEANKVTLSTGEVLSYQYLVVALGLQLNYNAIDGLMEGFESDPRICSNYSRETVGKTFPAIDSFKGGNAVFTVPDTPIKCAGASHFMYLADDVWRKAGVRDNMTITFKTAKDVIFHVKKYADSIEHIVERKNIDVHLNRNLIAVDHTKGEATFRKMDSGENETETCKYDFLHITPPMSAPDVLKRSKSPIVDDTEYLAVDKYTLEHVKYPNIFGIGDCTNLPTSKTAAAISSQSIVVLDNIISLLHGQTPTEKYDGYTSCPVVTGFNKCILSEFDYTGEPLETLPVDQSKERWLSFFMKEHLMPELYWHGLLTGHWNGPKPFRKLMHLGLGR